MNYIIIFVTLWVNNCQNFGFAPRPIKMLMDHNFVLIGVNNFSKRSQVLSSPFRVAFLSLTLLISQRYLIKPRMAARGNPA
jgi:hypothetical protein